MRMPESEGERMNILKVTLPVTLLIAGLMLCTTASYGKPEYMKKEGVKTCTTCHVKAGSKELNDMGKCYGANDLSLAKCKK
jgi:hypothetical protein